MIFLTFLGYSLLAVYESIPLYKQKQFRELWINSFLGICSFTIAVLLTFGISIPSPAGPIKQVLFQLLGK